MDEDGALGAIILNTWYGLVLNTRYVEFQDSLGETFLVRTFSLGETSLVRTFVIKDAAATEDAALCTSVPNYLRAMRNYAST